MDAFRINFFYDLYWLIRRFLNFPEACKQLATQVSVAKYGRAGNPTTHICAKSIPFRLAIILKWFFLIGGILLTKFFQCPLILSHDRTPPPSSSMASHRTVVIRNFLFSLWSSFEKTTVGAQVKKSERRPRRPFKRSGVGQLQLQISPPLLWRVQLS